jgi:hypothetical protein
MAVELDGIETHVVAPFALAGACCLHPGRSRMLADHGVAWIEEPVPADSVDDLAAVA